MMDLVSLMISLTCYQPIIVNHTNKWTQFDQQTLEHAYKGCREWDKNYPCVRKFIKKDATTYNVICGRIP